MNMMKWSWYLLSAAVCLLCLITCSFAQDDDPCVCLERFGSEEHYNCIIFETPPGDDDRIIVGEQRGLVYMYDRDGNRNSVPFLDLRDRMNVTGIVDMRGLLDMAFHPDYQTNRKVYAWYTQIVDEPYFNRLAEFLTDEENPDIVDMDTERAIIDLPHYPTATSSTHHGGALFFGTDDGFLYLSIGDSREPGLALDLTSLYGKVIRIDVNTGDDEIPYLIPEDNPFLDETDALPEIWALGLRQPWRCTSDAGDSETGEGRGRIICGDVGQDFCEEINIMVSGGNCAWDVKECIYCYDPEDTMPEEPVECIDDPVVGPGEEVLPVYWYTEWAKGQSITGGHVYRGNEIPAYNGDYLWADWRLDQGGLSRLRENEDGSWSNAEIPLCDASVCGEGLESEHAPYAFSFGQDQDLEMYILQSDSFASYVAGGVIYKVVNPENRKTTP